MIVCGDCLSVMAAMPKNVADAVVTDPPYGLGFMGKDWDHGVPGKVFWEELRQVAKPGAHLLAFGGTRTFHRLMCSIEDSGWEIRDTIMWVYGGGFPKSRDIGKLIDESVKVVCSACHGTGKTRNPSAEDWESYWLDSPCESCGGAGSTRGVERELVGVVKRTGKGVGTYGAFSGPSPITLPATEAAKRWSGWGTALKPAWEPVVLARNPLEGTVAENILRWGAGGINIDECVVGAEKITSQGPVCLQLHKKRLEHGIRKYTKGLPGEKFKPSSHIGRWPANLIHDGSDEVVNLFPGTAARFFYCAKASKEDREEGCGALEAKYVAGSGQAQAELRRGNVNFKGTGAGESGWHEVKAQRNHHPTVKPTSLMRYLCRLITPPGGLILDPFMGSGSTGKAAMLEGFDFLGIEIDEEYCRIAKRRIENITPRLPFPE